MSKDYTLGETLINLKDINLQFEGRPILKNINASVRDILRPGHTQGQVVGILGPSGRGKTQLSRIMSGLQKPTSGAVTVGPTADQQRTVEAGVVGVVAQNYPLFPHRTVIGNLVVAARQTGLDRKTSHDKAMDYLNRFELADKANNYPSQLSGGQRQRIAIIQQLLCSEFYLIMDEPFTGLDPLMKDKVCDLINQVASMHEHNTIFVIAHDIPAVCGIADTLWLLGKDRDPKTNELLPGATIQAEYNLVDLGLAWHPGISSTPQFATFVEEIKARFKNL